MKLSDWTLIEITEHVQGVDLGIIRAVINGRLYVATGTFIAGKLVHVDERSIESVPSDDELLGELTQEDIEAELGADEYKREKAI